MHIAIVTAGGAGMFCGSCMHDNTWARSLQEAGAEISLIPTYTPIRVDEQNMSDDRVFLGGINVYLDCQIPFWSKLPRFLTRWLDSPAVIRFATRFGVSNNADELGPLTLAMLEGEAGPQHREVEEFAEFLGKQLKPDLVIFSNALLVGALRTLKQHYNGPVYCTLQGDDVFLDALNERYRGEAIGRISERAAEFDHFLTHSTYYRDYMADYLSLPVDRFSQIPLGIDLDDHDGQPKPQLNDPPTIGYFARICPEKGLHNLVEAFRIVREKFPTARLRAGGFLPKGDVSYFRKLEREAADLGDAFEYIGSPDTHHEKVEFLKSLDLFSLPTDYQEPKGLSVLEALANGVPVVQPDHGAFPELITGTAGGRLYPAGDVTALARTLIELLENDADRLELATTGRQSVRQRYNRATMAEQSLELFGRLKSGNAVEKA